MKGGYVWAPIQPESEIFGDCPPPRFERGLKSEGRDAIERRWHETLEWRRQNNIDTILDEPQPNFAIMKQHYAHFYHKHARDGKLVYYERPGLSDFAKLKRELGVSVDDAVRHYMFVSECTWRVLDQDPDGQIVSVYDLAGTSMSQLAGDSLELFKAASSLYQAHYVERSGTIVLLNAPMWIRMAWGICSAFIHPNTRAKIKICKAGNLSQLFELVAPENVPMELGGRDPTPIMGAPEEALIRDHVERVLSQAHESATATATEKQVCPPLALTPASPPTVTKPALPSGAGSPDQSPSPPPHTLSRIYRAPGNVTRAVIRVGINTASSAISLVIPARAGGGDHGEGEGEGLQQVRLSLQQSQHILTSVWSVLMETQRVAAHADQRLTAVEARFRAVLNSDRFRTVS